MPFGGNLGVVFEACVKRFLLEKSGAKEGELKFVRGDEVRRPGVIICEGICKRIQEADFVTADITLPNPNVFYELGLSYRITQKLFVIRQKSPYGPPESFLGMGCTQA